MHNNKTPLSILDLVPICEGYTISDAIKNSIKLAQTAEKMGYKRFWVSEHHNIIDIASAATSVILSHIGAKTNNIRLGSGGVMLLNHSPLVIAEQFGTLETLYPNRIDLGIGRAPGTDYETKKALRCNLSNNEDAFPQILDELEYFLSKDSLKGKIKAIPGAGLQLPIYLLGSSTYSAKLAAKKGLGFAFASHFAPLSMNEAIKIYRENFKPSKYLDKPYLIICINAIAATTQEEAEYLATTELQKFLNLNKGKNQLVQKPVANMNELWSFHEERMIKEQLRESIWGTPSFVIKKLEELINRTKADEIMINSWIYDAKMRSYSYELIAKEWFKSK
ncbi:LLM class flavin-dependent oxidoreductase [Malaciobacter molluscorum LMG 25693]|uniref:Luciferase-like monooxygenase n=1 Tax=Malaciobacter molluscorum LMG 25693 TaxID=870501 RepID=A0A2G1DJS8_9BACT|nr:LLM class flavin-dependent oxidoreductase [Malaciobacter molluscorum]AXX92854.1 luciferase family oxidoreductase, group 1 [Malaciobacter molluscorum LMG 25693]PHO18690.1 LLM class flavin-dependent oxidoreductase [Malaciobacter molluscorum LMG 25693]RXJ96170.1 LLM class flavin-dependent oxidoreductase [Malaciobacter molluscorum]